MCDLRAGLQQVQVLQRSIEYAFKPLITTDGRRVEHTHELELLWEQAEATGEKIAADRNRAPLEKLSRYSGQWRYDAPGRENAQATWPENRTTGEDALTQARRRVPPFDRANTPSSGEP